MRIRDWSSDVGSSDLSQANRSATAHHYDDQRFVPVEQSGEDDSLLPKIMADAAGIIGTTARTIRRLLLSVEQKGTHRNRRDGTFDIRNIPEIGTSACREGVVKNV